MSPSPTQATHIERRDGEVVRMTVGRFRLQVRDPAGARRTSEHAAPVVRVGTLVENGLVLEDSAVSRIHCEIRAEECGYRLEDLGSTNGTYVDGVRVFDVCLKPGARIAVGRSEIVFEPLPDRVEVPLSAQDRFGPLLGRSTAMRQLFALLEKVAPSDVTVLVEGESGTGKELVAESIHQASGRSSAPLVVFDCAAVAPSLIEAELFGHERGAFTGAVGARAGAFEEADGGTLFIDEVGELPLALQPKLLRALERREVRRVGGGQTRRCDVRIVAATNRDLAAEVNRGAFRTDLYHRLAVVRLVVPPLRARPDDLPLLVRGFLENVFEDRPERAQAMLASLSGTWPELSAWPWSGNVRELRNAIDRTVAIAGDTLPTQLLLDPSALPADVAPAAPAAEGAAHEVTAVVDGSQPYLFQKNALLDRFEREYLECVLARHAGKIAPAAGAAGIDRSYFKRLMRKHGLRE